jgi:hypothetical protein
MRIPVLEKLAAVNSLQSLLAREAKKRGVPTN